MGGSRAVFLWWADFIAWPSLFEHPQSNSIEGRRHMY
jgi:hypothetical protein